MHLILKVAGKSIQIWPLQFPVVRMSASKEEKFLIREKYLRDMVLLAKIENAVLLEKETDWQLYFQAKARVQPKDVCLIDEVKENKGQVLKIVHAPTVYSNHKSLYK